MARAMERIMMMQSTELAELLNGYRRFRKSGWATNRDRWAALQEG